MPGLNCWSLATATTGHFNGSEPLQPITISNLLAQGTVCRVAVADSTKSRCLYLMTVVKRFLEENAHPDQTVMAPRRH